MSHFEPIAIVGRGCVLPGASEVDDFWSLVARGRVEIASAPPDKWRREGSRRLRGPDEPNPDLPWSDRGGYVRNFLFRSEGFRSECRAEDIARWSWHAARSALLESGHFGQEIRGGVVLGNLGFPTDAHTRLAESVWQGTPQRNFAAARYHGGTIASEMAEAIGFFGGPAFCLDAACASSLYAIELSCRALHERRIDVAIAGAVNCADDLFIHVGFCALDALSKTGRSRPFHRHADGLIPAEGAAVVALMRSDDARREGRPILAEIQGIGLSNDGRMGGFLAPAIEGQRAAIRAGYRSARIDAERVAYVECHATGTAVGDLTEARTLAECFERPPARPLHIGSVKGNFGHPITAAGAAGLLKVLGALEHDVLPPTVVEPEDIHPTIQRDDGLRVVSVAEPWSRDSGRPRIAAVSAFGFGGTNAHLVVSDPTQRARTSQVAVPRSQPIAIVGLGMRVGTLESTAAYEAAMSGPTRTRRMRQVVLDAARLRIPPASLQECLAQQSALLAAAMDAIRPLELDSASTAVVVGSRCDCEVARYGLRFRDLDRTNLVPPLSASAVLGTMPNIPANRLNVQMDLRGPSYTVSAEGQSGLCALSIAVRMLRSGEVRSVIVGASELGCEPVNEFALAAGAGHEPHGGDAALALVLTTEREARAQRLGIVAFVDEEDGPDGPQDWVLNGDELRTRHGDTGAAAGLLTLATGALACHRRGRLGEAPGEWTAEAPRVRVAVGNSSEPGFGSGRWVVASDPETAAGSFDFSVRMESPRVWPAHPPSLRATGPAPAPPLGPVASRPDSVHGAEPTRVPSSTPSEAPLLAPPTGWRRKRGVRRNFVERASRTESRPQQPRRSSSESTRAIDAVHAQMSRAHTDFLEKQKRLHEEFLAGQARLMHRLQARVDAPGQAVTAPHQRARTPVLAPSSPAVSSPKPTPERTPSERTLPEQEASQPTRPGPKFDRAALVTHASGAISTLFGDHFRAQDRYPVQVRMPEPPLLLADRVIGLCGEAGSMGVGKVWTETDVRADAWYLTHGRMPAGLMIESGQADLFLISWLGVDLLNRGERAYRLLGCTLTWHRPLPRPGETLAYEIEIDGHAAQGDVRLFFFHYDCHVDGELALSVRGGQAGFFTRAELDDSAGVLWSPEEEELTGPVRVDAPRVRTASAFDDNALAALQVGAVYECFGDGFEKTLSHVRSPALAGGRLRLLDRVDRFDPKGGPWGRGYLRASTTVRADDWFFSGHFKNDPCMPGTLMLEGGLNAMAFYLIAMGFTLDRDGWRFEPVKGVPYDMVCRGQVTPSSQELVYELFVEEVREGPTPTLYAHLLCTVDGLRAFHARRIGLELVADTPLSEPALSEALGLEMEQTPLSVATVGELRLDRKALLHSAIGCQSAAFGPQYEVFDAERSAPRLPGPPYHFISRVVDLVGAPWQRETGLEIVAEYDVPVEAWFLEANADPTVPFAVLNEVALQPCGWLATYSGAALAREDDQRFRNLDGEGELLSAVRPGETIRTKAKLISLIETDEMTLVRFEVSCRANGRDVYTLQTSFGFFPDSAFESQAGLASDPRFESLRRVSTAPPVELRPISSRLGPAHLSVLDRLIGLGETYAYADADVDPGAWYFRAHFYQDPVQPGSLGLSSLLALAARVVERDDLDRRVRSHRWKYRGQVVPSTTRVEAAIEIESTVASTSNLAGSLWVDDTRIYEAEFTLDLKEVCPEPAARPSRDEIASYWRRTLGLCGRTPWLGESVYLGLYDRFVHRVHLNAPVPQSRPVVFLCNHETAIETLMLSVVLGAASDNPAVTIAKEEHRESWFGTLLHWLFDHPDVGLEELTHYYDRQAPETLAPAMEEVLDRGRSLLIHAEGTRATRADHDLLPISGVPVDVALERDVPIIPVWVSGGLPPAAESTGEKLDFPWALARQDIFVGPSLRREDLAHLTYADRVQRVRTAILEAGPFRPAARGQAHFVKECRSWQRRLDTPGPRAVVGAILAEGAIPDAAHRSIVASLRRRRWSPDGGLSAQERLWVERLWHWLIA